MRWRLTPPLLPYAPSCFRLLLARVLFRLKSLEVQTMLSLLVSLLVTIPLCYAPAAFVTFLVRERACKSKRVRSRLL